MPVHLKGDAGALFSVAISLVALVRVAQQDSRRTIRCWDVETGRSTHTLGATSWVMGIAFSPDGSRLASAGMKPVRRIWTGPLTRLTLRDPGDRTHMVSPSARTACDWPGHQPMGLCDCGERAERQATIQPASRTRLGWEGRTERVDRFSTPIYVPGWPAHLGILTSSRIEVVSSSNSSQGLSQAMAANEPG